MQFYKTSGTRVARRCWRLQADVTEAHLLSGLIEANLLTEQYH